MQIQKFRKSHKRYQECRRHKDPRNEPKLYLTLRVPLLLSTYPDAIPISVNNIFLTSKRVLLSDYLHLILAGE